MEQSANGAAILHAYVQHTFGGAGSFLLAALIFIACLVTAVGLTCACAEFFAQYLPFSYRTLVFILGLFSMAVSNLGLSHLIQISIPVLTAIYPPCIALVVLSFTRGWWHNSSRVIAPAMFISLMFGIIDGIKASAFAEMMPSWGPRVCRWRSRAWPRADANRRYGGAGGYLGSRSGTSGDIQRALTDAFTQVFNHGTSGPVVFVFWSPSFVLCSREGQRRKTAWNTMESSNKLKRGLSTRHIRFMALGSAIGTGLFYGSADAIKMAGPSVLLAYIIGGAAAYIIMRALGEMSVHNPAASSFSRYAQDYLGPLAGYITG